MQKPYRKRSNRLDFYLSDDEYRVLLDSVQSSGLSVSEHGHKYVSELLGKETIDTNSYGHNKGRNGHFTKNDQVQARELLTF